MPLPHRKKTINCRAICYIISWQIMVLALVLAYGAVFAAHAGVGGAAPDAF